MYEEHAALVDKKFSGTLSKRETARLGYVRWQIERLEDADVGDALDELERLADLNESLADEIETFAGSVKDVRKHWQRRNRPRRG